MAGSEVGAPDKMTVFQKCVSSFNRSNVSAEDARNLLTQLVHLFYVGDTFQEAEATQLFFTITKLFQKESAGLKQMIYLAIKELVPFTDNVIMGTSVLMRDVQQSTMKGGNSSSTAPGSAMDPKLYRPQALRALCRILDAGAVEGMDRLMRSSIVDRDPAVASAGLVSSCHLLGIARDSVKRWSTEIQEACQAHNSITQYHALGLLREVRGHDTMAMRKLVVSLAEQNVLSDTNAKVLHARMAGELLVVSPTPDQLPLLQILQSYMKNDFSAAALEASKILLQTFPRLDQCNRDQAAVVNQALVQLCRQLDMPYAPSRFAAIRALNRYAKLNPDAVAEFNEDIEPLVKDSNQAIATYAITAMLKTGSDANIDSLVARIKAIVSDISDDFKLVVVDAVRSLARRFPEKHDQMLDFFAETLQHHGRFELKIAIVEAISHVLHADTSAESLNNALLMLCETIEDSEYPEVTIRVLHLLGSAGPRSETPSTYVRFIYNRIVLENAVVRAAAVSALAKFSENVVGVAPLVTHGLCDANDEVRDRASIAFVADVSDLPSSKMAMDDLEAKLMQYLQSGVSAKPFDATQVAKISDTQRFTNRLVDNEEPEVNEKTVESSATSGAAATPSTAAAGPVGKPTDLSAVPELAKLGTAIKSGSVQALTDSDMEYIVSARVHLFPSRTVVQYDVRNNYELNLENVTVMAALEDGLEDCQIETVVPAASLGPDETVSVYVVVKRQGLDVGVIESVLQFEVDGDADEYPVDSVKVRPADYLNDSSVADFETAWGELSGDLDDEGKVTEKLSGCKTVLDALRYLETELGLALAGDIPAETARSSQLAFSGVFPETGETVLARAQLVCTARETAVKLVVRSSNEDLIWMVSNGL